MNCKICESPGFRARKIKSASFHENKIFGFPQSHKMPIGKNLPDIQTRQIWSYSPFLEYQQGLLRNFSKSTRISGQRKDIKFEYAHGRIISYMFYGPLCFAEAFPIVYRQVAVHLLVSHSVLAGPHLLDTISIGNLVWEAHTSSGNYADDDLPPAVQEHGRTRQHAITRLYQEPDEHTGQKRTPSYAVAGIGD